MKDLGTKKLETSRLILRKFKILDANDMFNNYCTDSEVTKYLTWLPHKNIEVTKSVVKSWILNYKNKNFYQWAIVLKSTNQVVGTISVVRFNNETCSANIGYCLSRNLWGQGIMTEALQSVIDFLFKKVGVKEITSTHDVENVASGKVMLKCGMNYVRTDKNGGKNNRGVVDIKIYNILLDNYLNG